MERNGEDVQSYVENGESLRRSQIRIDARKWIASKMKPKKYGDTTHLVGADGGAIQVQHTKKLDISDLSEDQLDALEVALRATVLSLEGPKE